MPCLCYIYLIIYKSKQEKEGRRDRLGRERTRAAPRRSAILPASSSSSPPPSGGEGREEQSSRRNRKRENQGEGCRRHLRPSLASLLFCLLSSPSTPSPALTLSPAHAIAKGKGRTATPSPSSSPPSGGESRAASQTGRAIPPAHPADPLHPAGVRPNICGNLRRGGGRRSAIAGRRS